eukprot:CAMPEP_0194529488 /NCGR_PEP_ID=MMETSP0253-20130528/66194_1 /TAXON_ID=2966 /ORGANISM="Noctiluca scintillans" /LENGTH=61 /DNA_ID=CAMNT_0039374633 /DNA_START=148 /DNA_END=329 /DNA_ORIENTATION=-
MCEWETIGCLPHVSSFEPSDATLMRRRIILGLTPSTAQADVGPQVTACRSDVEVCHRAEKG